MSRIRPTPVDINAALAPLSMLRNRGPETSGPDKEAAFARLAETHNGAVFAGSFQGQSDWERHRNGDELVQILAGETQLTIVTDESRHVFEMKAGMLVIVPRGCWHKFDARGGVTVLTMTPQPTDHSTAEDPTQP